MFVVVSVEFLCALEVDGVRRVRYVCIPLLFFCVLRAQCQTAASKDFGTVPAFQMDGNPLVIKRAARAKRAEDIAATLEQP